MLCKSKKRWKILLQWLLALLLLAILFAWLEPDLSQLGKISRFSLAWVALALFLAFVASWLTAYRWKILAQWMGNPPFSLYSYLQAFLITRFVGQFSSALVMDLFGRGFALQVSERTSRYKTATLSIFLERIFDATIPLLLIAIWWIGQSLPHLSLAVLSLGFLLLWFFVSILAFPVGTRPSMYLFAKTRNIFSKFSRSASQSCSTPKSTTNRSDPKPTNRIPDPSLPDQFGSQQSLFIGLLSLLRMFFSIGQFWAIAISIDIQWNVQIAATSCAIAQLSSIISLTPGGLGVQEAGWSGALRMLGQPAHNILQFVVFQRITVLAIIGVLAAGAYILPKFALSKSSRS